MTCLHGNVIVQAIGPAPAWNVLMFKCLDCGSWWRSQLIYDGESKVYH